VRAILVVENDEVFGRIDSLVERIRRFAAEPEFSNDVARRECAPNFDLSDADILRTMIELIAFSQQAPASRIVEMIRRGIFQDIFGSFAPSAVALMEPEDLRQKHWHKGLSPIRFRNKVDKMVGCAQSLQSISGRHGSFMGYLATCNFPEQIDTSKDIDAFWLAFEKVRTEAPSFFTNFTSLCHLLQSLGLPCAKPDKIVMNVAAELGIVAMRKQHSEADLRKVIQLMQSYAAQKRIHVPVVDLFFLIRGGQTDAKKFVRPPYYTN
jgi:3-methyladenine DNA glycosylase Tag